MYAAFAVSLNSKLVLAIKVCRCSSHTFKPVQQLFQNAMQASGIL